MDYTMITTELETRTETDRHYWEEQTYICYKDIMFYIHGKREKKRESIIGISEIRHTLDFRHKPSNRSHFFYLNSNTAPHQKDSACDSTTNSNIEKETELDSGA